MAAPRPLASLRTKRGVKASWYVCSDLDALPSSLAVAHPRLAMVFARDVVAAYRLVFNDDLIVFRGLVNNKQNDFYDMFLFVADSLATGSDDSP